MLPLSTGEEGPPEAPAFEVPDVTSAPAPGFAQKLGASLASFGPFKAAPYESGRSRFGRGLLHGAAAGFSKGAEMDAKHAADEASGANAVAKTAADRHNMIATESWKAGLVDFYKTKQDKVGKIQITDQMAKDLNLPVSAVGTFEKALDIAKYKETADAREKDDEHKSATLQETIRHDKAIENKPSGRYGGSYIAPGTMGKNKDGTWDTSISLVGDAIREGTQSPDTKGLYRMTLPIRAYLAEKGYDLLEAQNDALAVNKFIAAANGAPQLRMTQQVNTAYKSVPLVRSLIQDWSAKSAAGTLPILNSALLLGAEHSGLDPEASFAARRMRVQIFDLATELAAVNMGGTSPTDQAFKKAEATMRGNWSMEDLMGVLDLAEDNLAIRRNSLKFSSPAGLSAKGEAKYGNKEAKAAAADKPVRKIDVSGAIEER